MKTNSKIPSISRKEIRKLAKRIKPVIRFAMVDEDGRLTFSDTRGKIEPYTTGLLYYIIDVDPFNIAFTWSPQPNKRAENIEFLDAIITYHTFGAPVLFKPLISEVLSQIPRKYLSKVVAFETVTNDLNSTNVVSIDGHSYHHTITRLYRERQT